MPVVVLHLSSVDEQRYKTYRKHYKQLTKEAKRTYYKELFDTRSNSVKQLWNNLNQMVSLSKNKRTNIINKILVNNYYVEDPKTISNHFNQYFCSVGLNLQNQFKLNDGSEFRSYLNSPIKDSMFCCAVSKDEILNIIAKFKNYADDTNVFIHGKMIHNLIVDAEMCLAKLSKWL